MTPAPYDSAAGAQDILGSISDAFFALDRDWRFTYVNEPAQRLLGKNRRALFGRIIWDELSEWRGATYENEFRRAVAEQVARSFDECIAPPNEWFEVRVYPSRVGLSVVIQNINARKIAEEALKADRAGLLSQMQVRAEREELINHVGQALLALTPPVEIQERVVNLLGEALSIDRCYLAFWDETRDRILVLPDFQRADLSSMAGEYRLSEYAPVMDALFAHGTAVLSDVDISGLPSGAIGVLQSFNLRSLVAVPVFDNDRRLAAGLFIAMADEPRAWTAEEVSLTETIAALTRASLERERLALKEHNIATRLQEALTPAIPNRVPGLALSSHYDAALDEARVGGDFYDVFPIDNWCTALIVGDLSGKGLAAAAQVATVRNMLRYALYRSRTTAGALSSLNALLIEQNLLAGFATMFVGVYHSNERLLHYVNCGQEPALVRRRDGTIDTLNPTGPVLGSCESAVFDERVATLAAGDALVVFTDGITECGATRWLMLGIEGVVSLLEPCFSRQETEQAELLANAVSRRMVHGVEAASLGGVAKDDICILVAVAEENQLRMGHNSS